MNQSVILDVPPLRSDQALILAELERAPQSYRWWRTHGRAAQSLARWGMARVGTFDEGMVFLTEAGRKALAHHRMVQEAKAAEQRARDTMREDRGRTRRIQAELRKADT